MHTSMVAQKSTDKNLLGTLFLNCHLFSALYWLAEEQGLWMPCAASVSCQWDFAVLEAPGSCSVREDGKSPCK